MMTDLMPLSLFAMACAATLLAGMVKGLVGFAMPMVMISLLGSFLPPDVALAGLIVPTLVANGVQALRQGMGAAWASMRKFWLFLVVGLVMLGISAQLVRILSADTLLLMIGVPITVFTLMQIAGWRLHLPARGRHWIEGALGGIAGFIGGMSGIWGPPTVMYLTALETPKADQMRIQGVIYGLGAVALLGAHVGSGVMRAETLPFSLAMVVPAVIGMSIGLKVSDRIDQVAFRKATLAVLLIAGVNLIRRGLM